jgi:hypothetical protein
VREPFNRTEMHVRTHRISAGERQTDSLVEALPPALRATALRDARMLLRLDSPSLEDTVTRDSLDAHSAFERRLVEQVREQAQWPAEPRNLRAGTRTSG